MTLAGVVFGLVTLGIGIGGGAPMFGLIMCVVLIGCGILADLTEAS